MKAMFIILLFISTLMTLRMLYVEFIGKGLTQLGYIVLFVSAIVLSISVGVTLGDIQISCLK